MINGTITWAEARQIVKERNIGKRQLLNWYRNKDYGNSSQKLLELIVHHIYHSSSDKLIAPPHLLQSFLEDFHCK